MKGVFNQGVLHLLSKRYGSVLTRSWDFARTNPWFTDDTGDHTRRLKLGCANKPGILHKNRMCLHHHHHHNLMFFLLFKQNADSTGSKMYIFSSLPHNRIANGAMCGVISVWPLLMEGRKGCEPLTLFMRYFVDVIFSEVESLACCIANRTLGNGKACQCKILVWIYFRIDCGFNIHQGQFF